jgi:ubiquinone biosynthesis protein UbiJ
MTTAAFDTLRFSKRLKEAGFTESQAEALAEAIKDASGEAELATKADVADVKRDIKELELKIDARFEGLKGELTLLKWMLGLLLGGTVALILKTFF